LVVSPGSNVPYTQAFGLGLVGQCFQQAVHNGTRVVKTTTHFVLKKYLWDGQAPDAMKVERGRQDLKHTRGHCSLTIAVSQVTQHARYMRQQERAGHIVQGLGHVTQGTCGNSERGLHM